MDSQAGLRAKLTQLVFNEVDRDGSGTITDDEFGDLLEALELPTSGGLAELLARYSATLTAEGLHNLVFASGDGMPLKLPNLGMLCRPSHRVGAFRIERTELDRRIGHHDVVPDAIDACGILADGGLAASERCKLYAAMWGSAARGAWTLERQPLELWLQATLTSCAERAVAGAWVRADPESEWAARLEAERRRLALALTGSKADGARHELLTGFGGLRPSENRAGAKGSLTARVSFGQFCDAWEALVQHPAKGATPGGVLLWRLYALLRIRDGFPVGAPFALSAETAARVSAPFSAVDSAAKDGFALPMLAAAMEKCSQWCLRPVSLLPGGEEPASAVPTVEAAHRLRQSVQGLDDDARRAAGGESEPETRLRRLPLSLRLRSVAGPFALVGTDAHRPAWSAGNCPVLSGPLDEEDAALADALRRAGLVERCATDPRRQPWPAALGRWLEDDPDPAATLSRWLFQVLHTPSSLPEEALEIHLDPDHAPPPVAPEGDAGAATAAPSRRASRRSAVLEAAGPPLLAILRAAWYRARLELCLASRDSQPSAEPSLPGQVDQKDLRAVRQGAAAREAAKARAAAELAADTEADDDVAEPPVSSWPSAATGADAPAAPAAPSAAAARAAPAAGGEASWTSVTHGFPRLLRRDLELALLAGCFPPLRAHCEAHCGRMRRRREAARSAVSRALAGAAGLTPPGARAAPPTAVQAYSCDGSAVTGAGLRSSIAPSGPEELWASATREDSVDLPPPMPASAERRKAVLGWDGADPFSVSARWLAFGHRWPKLPGEAPPTTVWTVPGRAAGAGARGRVSVLRWCVESSTAVREALHDAGRRPAVARVRAAGPKAELNFADPWAVVLAHSLFFRLADAVRSGAAPQSEAASALEAAFAAECLGLAAGLGTVPRTRWRLGRPPAEHEVREWHAALTAADGRVSWSGLLAAASWDAAEEPLPRNAGALVDLEPLPGSDAAPSLPPARVMALLVVLSQSVPPPAEEGAASVRSWAAEAKAAIAGAYDGYSTMAEGAGRLTAFERRSMWRSALLQELWIRRGLAAASALSAGDFLRRSAAIAEGGRRDGPAAVMARALHLAGGAVADADPILRTLGAARA